MGCTGSTETSSSKKESALISAEQLEKSLASVQVLDCSFGEGVKDAYLARHIPGAVFLSMGDFKDSTSAYPNMMPNKEQISSHLQGLGIGSSKPIVCYDQNDNVFASRAAFVLVAWGFKNVTVLNGGMKAWSDRATEEGDFKGKDTKLDLA